MRKIFVAVIVLVLVSGTVMYLLLSPQQKKGTTITVYRVLDGDTIEMSNGDIVRLIGIDAPEKTQPLFKEVTEELSGLVGKAVVLELDKSNKDSYGRLLRYIYLGEDFVNLELVRSGLASAYIVEPDSKYADDFISAEKYARENMLGIWERSDHEMCVAIQNFHYNARGIDSENMADEYLDVYNSCDYALDADGWVVRDHQSNSYAFKGVTIQPLSSVRLVSGGGEPQANAVYWQSKYPVWNNDGDVLTLRDAQGKLVAHVSYGNP
jgi:micrococcal nuclease